MQVTGSNVSMTMSHQYTVQYDRRNNLDSWAGLHPDLVNRSPLFELSQSLGRLRDSGSDLLDKNDDYQTGRLAKQAQQALAKDGKSVAALGENTLTNKQATIIRILEHVFGMKGIKQYSLNLDYSSINSSQQSAQERLALADSQQSGWGMSYDYNETYRQYHATTLAMSGTVTTEDGRAFAFSIDYKMEHSLERTTNYQYRAGDAVIKDPLKINFGGTSGIGTSGFGLQRQAFDYSNTKGMGLLPQILNGSNSLGKDLSKNKPDSTSDLFKSGSVNGQIDLAAHDDDGNGFIDSKDAIWDELRLWAGDRPPVLLSMWRVSSISLTRIEEPLERNDVYKELAGKKQSADKYSTDNSKAAVSKLVDVVI